MVAKLSHRQNGTSQPFILPSNSYIVPTPFSVELPSYPEEMIGLSYLGLTHNLCLLVALILVLYLRRDRITGIQTVINTMLLARTLRPFVLELPSNRICILHVGPVICIAQIPDAVQGCYVLAPS